MKIKRFIRGAWRTVARAKNSTATRVVLPSGEEVYVTVKADGRVVVESDLRFAITHLDYPRQGVILFPCKVQQ